MTVRPEFDVTLAYNPDSVLMPVTRIEGIGWTLLGAGTGSGGSIVAGQGGVVRLDGSADPVGPRELFVRIGGDAAGLSGNSRAAQWMILDQLIDEVRGRIPPDANAALLTPAGRATLAKYLGGGGRVVVAVDRAADIRQLLRWSARHNVRIAIAGGAEAWKLAPQLAAAKVPVFVNPLGRTCRRTSTRSARPWRTRRACARPACRSASRRAAMPRTTRARCASWPAMPWPMACPGTMAWPG